MAFGVMAGRQRRGGPFTPFSKSGTGALDPSADPVSYWNTGDANSGLLAVFSNLTKQPVTFSDGVVVQPGALVLHPGARDNRLAVVRFTAPADGRYVITTTLKNLDVQAKKTGFSFSVRGMEFSGRELAGPVSRPPDGYTYFLRKGDPVDFAASNGSDKDDTYKDDAVELKLEINRVNIPSTPQLAGGSEGPLTDQDTISTGDIHLIVAFVDFADAKGDPNADYQAIWDKLSGSGKLAEMFKTQSAGKAKLTAQVITGWRTMPKKLSDYFPVTPGWDYQAYTQDAAGLYNKDSTQKQITVTANTIMVVVPPQDVDVKGWKKDVPSGNHSISWNGMRRIITMAPTAYSEHYTTLAHEIGHAFGLGELYPAASPFAHEVAGYDLMGDVVYATGFIGWHRHKFLWMDDARKAYLTTRGVYIIPLRPLSDTNGINMVIVPDKSTSATKPTKVWVVEINQDVIARADAMAGNGKKLVSAGDGILIYTVENPPQTGKRALRLIQPGPENKWVNLQNNHPAALYKRLAVTTPEQSPIKVTVRGKSATEYVVVIDVLTNPKLP